MGFLDAFNPFGGGESSDLESGLATFGWAPLMGELREPGEKQAEAMGRMAEAQERVAREGLEYQKETRRMAMEAAQPGYEELAAIDRITATYMKALDLQGQNIAREEALLESVDPALKEAGMQAFQLLRGEDAKVLDPIRRQREMQRKNLENRLASQLGPGWSTSSAGIQAINDFDFQTDMTLSSAQQQAVGTLLGTAAAVRPDMSQEIASMANVLGGLAGQETAARQNIAGREISAITGTPVSFADVVKTAGGGEIEELYKQQVKAQQIGQVLGIGGTILGGMFGGPGGAAAGQQAGQAAAPTTIM